MASSSVRKRRSSTDGFSSVHALDFDGRICGLSGVLVTAMRRPNPLRAARANPFQYFLRIQGIRKKYWKGFLLKTRRCGG
jgi:hypothetical protein